MDIVRQLTRSQDENDVFVQSYGAYLCSEVLERRELANEIFDVLESYGENVLLKSSNIVLALNFLESFPSSNTRSRQVIQRIICLMDVEKVCKIHSFTIRNENSDLKNAIVIIPSSNSITIGVCYNWFAKSIDIIDHQDVSFYLHRFNKLDLSYLIKGNTELTTKLRDVFLRHHASNNYLQIEYRRNGIMTEEMLQAVENRSLQLLRNNLLSMPQAIDHLYNITRLRFADNEILERVVSMLEKRSHEMLFPDYVKLLNTLVDQQASNEIILSLTHRLDNLMSTNQIDIKTQPLQQIKLFYVWILQFKDYHPNLLNESKTKAIQKFISDSQQQMDYYLQKSEKKTIQSDPQVGFETPYNQYIEQALNQLNIPYQREYGIVFYKIDFFLPDQKVCIELNGDLHYFNNTLTPPSLKKYNILKRLGYTVFPIQQKAWRLQHSQGFCYESVLGWLKKIQQEY